MEQENKGKGMSSCEQLTEVLFGNGVNKSMQMCFDLLMNLTHENKRQSLVVIHSLCLDINRGKDPKIRGEEMRAKAISCIIQATYIACQDWPDLRIQWLKMLEYPLTIGEFELKKYGPNGLESFVYGVIIGMLHCLNEHTYPDSDKIELNGYLETAFVYILCNLISQPEAPLHIILPVDVIRDEINKGLEKYIKPNNQEIARQRKAFIGPMLTQIKRNLAVESPEKNKDPWNSRLLNYHFSRILLEKLIYALWGSFSLMEMLSYFVEGGLRYDEKTSPTTSHDDLSTLAQEVEKDFQPDAKFPVADGDYETHFDLGKQFKEMGSFKQAIEEFEMATNLAQTSDDRLKCERMKETCLEELEKNKG
jgi:hypothetical protein